MVYQKITISLAQRIALFVACEAVRRHQVSTCPEMMVSSVTDITKHPDWGNGHAKFAIRYPAFGNQSRRFRVEVLVKRGSDGRWKDGYYNLIQRRDGAFPHSSLFHIEWKDGVPTICFEN